MSSLSANQPETISRSPEIGSAARVPTSHRERLAIAAIALFGVTLRIAPLFARSGVDWAMKADDSFQYIQLGQGLRAGCGFARLDSGVRQYRNPGRKRFNIGFGEQLSECPTRFEKEAASKHV
jgi:hypothetical protein